MHFAWLVTNSLTNESGYDFIFATYMVGTNIVLIFLAGIMSACPASCMFADEKLTSLCGALGALMYIVLMLSGGVATTAFMTSFTICGAFGVIPIGLVCFVGIGIGKLGMAVYSGFRRIAGALGRQ